MSFNPNQYMYKRPDDEPRYSTTTRRGNQPTQRRPKPKPSNNTPSKPQNPPKPSANPVIEVQPSVQSVPYAETQTLSQPSQYPTYNQTQYHHYTQTVATPQNVTQIRQSPYSQSQNSTIRQVPQNDNLPHVSNAIYSSQHHQTQNVGNKNVTQQQVEIVHQHNTYHQINQMNHQINQMNHQNQMNQIDEIQEIVEMNGNNQINEIESSTVGQKINAFSTSYDNHQTPYTPHEQPENAVCCYCESPLGLVQCADCNKMICNGGIFNSSDCQILTHIRLCSHTNIKVKGKLVICCECEDTNIFNLRYSVDEQKIMCHTCVQNLSDDIRRRFDRSIIEDGKFDLTYFKIKSSNIPVKKEVIVNKEKHNENAGTSGTAVKRNYKIPKESYASSKEYFDVYQPLFGLEELQQRKIEEGDYKVSEKVERVKFVKEKGQLKLEIISKTKQVMKGISRTTDFIICLDGKHNLVNISDLEAIYKKQSKGIFNECKKVFFGKVDSWNDTKVKINLEEGYFEDMKSDYHLHQKQTYDEFVYNKKYKIVRYYCIFNPNKPLNPNYINSFGNLEKTSYGKSLLGTLQPPEEFFEGADLSYEISLNQSQKKAVLRALNNQVSVIFGPPGSGKTSTIVSIALNYLKHFDDIVDLESVAFEMNNDIPIQPKVLTCAPSNAAVNILAERLERFCLRVCRIISIEKLDNLDDKLWEQCVFNWALKYACDHPEVSEKFTFMVKKYNSVSSQGYFGMKQNETNRKNARYQMVASEEYNLIELLKELKTRKFNKNVVDMERQKKDVIEKFISRNFTQIIEDSNCVCCSTKACGKKYFQDIRFVCTIMDEATQAVELDTLIPALKSTRLVLVGDLQQLNSIIQSKEAERIGYGKSMFERLLNCNVTRTTLKEQYRMHPGISKLINSLFYDNILVDKTSNKETQISLFPNKKCPFVFIGHRGKERYYGKGSVFNDTEVEIVKKVLDILMNQNGISQEQIGVISPYVAQKEEINFDGTSSSVDGFQGSEKEYIVLSTVRSNESKGAGFIAEYRRINVALSRAKHGLVVVGNELTLGMSPVWRKVLNYLAKNDSILMYDDDEKEFKPFHYNTSSDDNYEESDYKCYFLEEN